MNSPDLKSTHTKARQTLLLVWLTLLGLLVCWWLVGLHWPPTVFEITAGLLIAPLAMILPAIIRGSVRASSGASLLLIPYIGWAITETVANPGARLISAAVLLAAVLCFVLVIYWLRVLRSD